MGRFRDSSSEETESAIDISPLIDCVFILLIFFIVTTVFVEETGVDVERPEAAASSQLDKNSILLAITPDGEIVYGGRALNFNGIQPLVKRLLQTEPDMPVIIQADQDSMSGILVKVVGECKLAGAEKVSVATKRG